MGLYLSFSGYYISVVGTIAYSIHNHKFYNQSITVQAEVIENIVRDKNYYYARVRFETIEGTMIETIPQNALRYLLEHELGRIYTIRYHKDDPHRASLGDIEPRLIPIFPAVISAIFFFASLSLLLPAMAVNKAKKALKQEHGKLEKLLHQWVDIIASKPTIYVKEQISLLIRDRYAYLKEADNRGRDSLLDDANIYAETKDVAVPALIWVEFTYILTEEHIIYGIDWKESPEGILEFLGDDINKYLPREHYRTLKDIADKVEEGSIEFITADEYFAMIQDALKDTSLRLFFVTEDANSYIFATLPDDEFAKLSAITEQIKTLLQLYNPHQYLIEISTKAP